MIKRIQAWLSRNDRQEEQPAEISPDNIPRHIAIIMDGNGRWAKRRGLPRIVGHQNGMKAVKRATIAANDLGVEFLTMYAFSTENWKRPKDEVDFLMKLPVEFLALELDELIEKMCRYVLWATVKRCLPIPAKQWKKPLSGPGTITDLF